MANHGNTGQRYRLQRRTEVSIRGDKVHVVLECGHSYDVEPLWGSVEEWAAMLEERIGKRERCNRCKVS